MTVFEASGALNPEEHSNIIVHRAELDEIITHIENKDDYVVLQAPTQSGKTTLLYQIQSRLHQQGYGLVYLDLSLLADLEPAKFYPEFCTEIRDELAGLIVDNTDPNLAPDKVTNQISLSRYLKLISKKTQQIRKLVFMIDEFSNLSDEMTTPLFSTLRSFFTRGRGISNDRDYYKKVMFIFAGDLDLDKLIQGKNSPLKNICKTFTLDDFSQEQVLDLAQNLANFTPEIIKVISGCVHQWCDGHPSLTQCLLGLIDESQECQNTSSDNLPVAIQELVKVKILQGSNPNLAHIYKYLRNSGDSYCRSVAQILRSKPEALSENVPHDQELILMGIIKRSSNRFLVIRNKIYKEALEKFFDTFQLQGRT
ncbi:MAG: AAA-like domain-containing protein [Xenococcus sp. MO_188.B8]|nr:AAA-like domain-containing protein [Xenococcus sp. MO_188.B8]